jgi:hypothetical protein
MFIVGLELVAFFLLLIFLIKVKSVVVADPKFLSG